MKLILNGAYFGNARQIHNFLANQLHFPEWYGGNLDALYDCLTDLVDDTELVLRNWPHDGEIGKFSLVFCDASRENQHLKVTIE